MILYILKYYTTTLIIMTATWYSIAFDYEGIHYDGRLTPETKADHKNPSSWHIVLNEVFFGYLHKDSGHWHVSEQRPSGLVQEVGKLIELTGYQFN